MVKFLLLRSSQLPDWALHGEVAARVAYRAAHVGERLLCPLHAAALCAHRERPRDVATELHGDAAALK